MSRRRKTLLAAVALVLQGRDQWLDPAGVEFLVAALKHENVSMRIDAAGALGELGDPRAVKPLEGLLGDEDPYVRMAVTKALEKLRRQSQGKPFGGAQDKP